MVLLLVPVPPVSLPVPVLPVPVPVPVSVSVSVSVSVPDPVLPGVVVTPPVVLAGPGPSGEVSQLVLASFVSLSSIPVDSTIPGPSGDVSHVVPPDESDGSSSSHPATPAESAPATTTVTNARALGFLVKLTMVFV